MDIWEAVEILNERYPSDGRDPLEECRRVKEEMSKESAGLSFDELMKYYGDCDFDDSEIKIEYLNREGLLRILDVPYCEIAEEAAAGYAKTGLLFRR
jgi:hypothetical protein